MSGAEERRTLPESGDFQEHPFALVFWTLARDRRTGQLDIRDRPPFEGGKIIKRVLIHAGSDFAVQGGGVPETLGSLLVARGRITPEQYEALKADAGGDYGKIEQKVLSGAVIPAAEIPELAAFQVRLKLKNLFPLIRGHYDFKSLPGPEVIHKNILMPVEVEKLMLEAVAEHYPVVRIRKELEGIEKKNFRLAGGAKERLLRLGFEPSVLRWLRNLPESFTWQSVMRGAPLKENQVLSLLLALYFLEILILPPEEEDFPFGRVYLESKETREAKPGVKAAGKTPASPIEKPTGLSAPGAGAAKPEIKPPEERLPIEEMLDRDLSDEEIIKEIDRLSQIAAGLKHRKSTYFDLLGVAENTPVDKVKKIYLKFAKKFHPDTRPELFVDERREQVEDLFAKINEAYQILSDLSSRAEYLKKLKVSVTDKEIEMVNRALEAEKEFMKAEVLMKRGAWKDAAELLERAVAFCPEEMEYKMHLAWTHYKLKGASDLHKARQIIRETLQKNPAAVDGYFYLGILEKNEGELDKAEEYLQKYLEKKPYDVDAKRELQLLLKRKSGPSPKKKGGLFGKKT